MRSITLLLVLGFYLPSYIASKRLLPLRKYTSDDDEPSENEYDEELDRNYTGKINIYFKNTYLDFKIVEINHKLFNSLNILHHKLNNLCSNS